MAAGVTIDQAAAVDLDSNSRGQIVGDQQFVDWVFQGIEGAAGLQQFAIEGNLSPPKSPSTRMRLYGAAPSTKVVKSNTQSSHRERASNSAGIE